MKNITLKQPKTLFYIVFILTISFTPLTTQATLLGQDITVTFSESGFDDLADIVNVDENIEISEFDGTNIGDLILFEDEYIDIGSESIFIQLQGGGDPHSTADHSLLGFGSDANYNFTNLNWGSLPGRITGVEIILDNIIGVSLDSEVSFTDNSVNLIVGTLGVGEISGTEIGSVTLNLTVDHSPVPLPASLPLFLSALILVSRRFRLK